MQYIIRYDVKSGKSTEYRDWVVKNHQALVDHAPEGWHYLGTWFTVHGFGSYAAETRWELDDYSSLGSGFGDEEYQALLGEWMDFGSDHTSGETYLMKNATDVAIVERD